MDITTATALRATYLHVFDSFATDPVSVADQVKEVGNARHAREVLGVLVNAGLVIQDQVNGGEDVWQAAETYDMVERSVAEKTIDSWLAEQGVEKPTPAQEVKVPMRKNTKPKADPNPADLPLCKCGCGSPCSRKSNYRPGHDARHAGNVARAIAASEDYTLLNDLPTDALRDKASAMAERLMDKAVAKEKAQTVKAEAKAEAKIDAIYDPAEDGEPTDTVIDVAKPAPAPRKAARKSRSVRNAEAAAAKQKA